MDHSTAIAEVLVHRGFRRFAMSRTPVGHLKVAGQLDGRSIDIVIDTGVSKTFVELGYCRSEGIAVSDTGMAGARAAGAVNNSASNLFMLDDAHMTLDGLAIKSDGLFAIEPIRAVIGQDASKEF